MIYKYIHINLTCVKTTYIKYRLEPGQPFERSGKVEVSVCMFDPAVPQIYLADLTVAWVVHVSPEKTKTQVNNV